MPEHVITLTDEELEDIRASLQMRIDGASSLMSALESARTPSILDVLDRTQKRLGRLDAKLATREVKS